ncbi:hypothetical protein [Nonomuraea aridisoli]|uniref:DUF1877 family protein n=1 Tax=Nonomuraea aridisoli TaxID=2070368 RepID=A0A2W2EY77_9ACTN|nr:hypothetical protein [Nonomuraea aridisoli]PZG21215.1 hypothetical protein C1J01_07085 [Nonomuraea aridisoli]
MGVLYDYFGAATDEEAAAVVDWVGGPAYPPLGAEQKDSVDLKGIDPAVMLGKLEALLVGRSYDEIAESHGVSAVRFVESGEKGVVSVADRLTAVLAEATDEQLVAVAGAWSETEEFHGLTDPAVLHRPLHDLRDLAARIRQRGHRLYCWMSI